MFTLEERKHKVVSKTNEGFLRFLVIKISAIFYEMRQLTKTVIFGLTTNVLRAFLKNMEKKHGKITKKRRFYFK